MNRFPDPLNIIPELQREFRREAKKFARKAVAAIKRRKRVTRKDLKAIKKIVGRKTHFDAILASDCVAREMVVGEVFRGLKKVLTDSAQAQVLHVTLIHADWATTDERTVVERQRAFSTARKLLAGIGSDWIGALELQGFTNVRHPLGHGRLLGPHLHILIWGEGISERANKLAEVINAEWPPLPCNLKPMDVQNAITSGADLCRLIRYLFKAPSKQKTLYFNPKTGASNFHESEKGDRYVRYLRQLQILSSLELGNMVFASGQGAVIRRSALKEVAKKYSISTSPRKSAVVLRAVASFWKELADRLNIRLLAHPPQIN